MAYAKPEILNLPPALSVTQGTRIKGVCVFVEYATPTIYFLLTCLAYEADE